MKKILSYLILFIALTQSAWSLDETMKNYRGVRSLGMGGVVTTTGVYDEALFANPAMMPEAETWKISILNLTAEVNSNIISDSSKVSKIQSGSGTDTLVKASELLGKNEHLRLTLLPGFYAPRIFGTNTSIAFAVLVNVQTNLFLRSNADLETQLITDAGPNLHVGRKLLEDRLNLGVNIHALYRLAADKAVAATDFLSGKKPSPSSIGGQGMGIDMDFGAYYKIPFELFEIKPSVGLSVNNIFKSDYGLLFKDAIKTISARPPGNERFYNLGTRLDFPDFLFLQKSLVALEVQDIGGNSKLVSIWKRVHMGGETRLLNWSWFSLAIRAGINQGYLGGGLGLDLPLLKLDFATYGEELGPVAGSLEDRRYVVRLCLDI